jgi:hypothetical protein
MKLPWMRLEYEYAIGELASLEIQERIWPNPPPFCGFDLVIHIIFDDINLRESEGLSGDIGLSSSQLRAALKIMELFDAMWNRCGTEAEPGVLMAEPEWLEVVETAKAILATSETSDSFKQHCQSADLYGQNFDPPNPFLDESDKEYIEYLRENECQHKATNLGI